MFVSDSLVNTLSFPSKPRGQCPRTSSSALECWQTRKSVVTHSAVSISTIKTNQLPSRKKPQHPSKKKTKLRTSQVHHVKHRIKISRHKKKNRAMVQTPGFVGPPAGGRGGCGHAKVAASLDLPCAQPWSPQRGRDFVSMAQSARGFIENLEC